MGRLTVLERDHARVQEDDVVPVDLGPLLAVCGLTGGAGATTLAYLVALAAAEQDGGPVLVADTGGPSGGLAALAGVETPHSLAELAAQIAADRPLEGGVYATGAAGVRVLASGPEFTAPCAPEQLGRLLIDAREAHRLTVIDCGTLGRARRPRCPRRRHPRRVGPARDRGWHPPRAARARGRTRRRSEAARRRTAGRTSVQGVSTRAPADRQ